MKWTPKLSRNQQRRERRRQRKKEAEENRANTSAVSVSAAEPVPEGCVRYHHRDKEGHVLSILLTHHAKPVLSLNDLPEWEEIEMGVDSGATETVVGPDMLTGI